MIAANETSLVRWQSKQTSIAPARPGARIGVYIMGSFRRRTVRFDTTRDVLQPIGLHRVVVSGLM